MLSFAYLSPGQDVRIGLYAGDHLAEHDTVREDISPLVVPLPGQTLGGHPIRGAHDR